MTLDSDRPLKAAEMKLAEQTFSMQRDERAHTGTSADVRVCSFRCRDAHGRRGSLDAGRRRHAAGVRCQGADIFDPGSRRSKARPWSGRWKVPSPSSPTSRLASWPGRRPRSCCRPVRPPSTTKRLTITPWAASGSRGKRRPTTWMYVSLTTYFRTVRLESLTHNGREARGPDRDLPLPARSVAAEQRGRLSAGPGVASLETG